MTGVNPKLVKNTINCSSAWLVEKIELKVKPTDDFSIAGKTGNGSFLVLSRSATKILGIKLFRESLL